MHLAKLTITLGPGFHKIVRYAREWALALREMASRGVELFLPAHGLPIQGEDRIRRVLNEVADVLDYLVW